ncbi:MAG: hypothetical protein [Wendovervirus sonii]|uniref:Uncharacterized protein n=1 Tax=phage Lak_Megaphage_Sonny TaxID=3109229 RepID=A0ABZ0Z636_9CAUD|nr:MAG: hypothetical protein [phage Lak_Megaphage_Sonny]
MLKKNKKENKVHQIAYFSDYDRDTLVNKINRWLSDNANKIENPVIHFQTVHNGSNTWKYALIQYIQK